MKVLEKPDYNYLKK
jgi:hypothetical protein